MTRFAFAAAAAGSLALISGSAKAIVYFDGVFSPPNWSSTVITDVGGAGSSSVGFQFLTGGNPNEYFRVRNSVIVNASVGYGSVFGIYMNNTAFYDPFSQGAISQINYSEDSINFVNQGGNGQSAGLALVQSGKIYVLRTPTLVMPYAGYSTWTPNVANALTAGDFFEVTNLGVLLPASNPDFSASGGVIQLGFYRGNSGNLAYGTDCGIDNWRVEIVPSPAGATVLAAAGLLVARRRRR